MQFTGLTELVMNDCIPIAGTITTADMSNDTTTAAAKYASLISI